VNLNLLAAFDALFEERSVTRAARRSGVTQSAMSSSLAQLRRLFDDPLFVRTSHGIEPTRRALALAEPVHQGLRLFAEALSPPSFDPRTASRSFVLMASDHVEFVLLPPLLRRLERDAPSVRLELRPWGLHEVPAALARGEADLMIGFYDALPARHRQQLIFEEAYACVVRRGHPRVRRTLSLNTWLELRHVLVSERGDSPGSVDRALAARGLTRVVGARVSHFLMAPQLVARTDMVAAISRRVADVLATPLKLAVFTPPIALPKGRVGQVWHEQMDGDPGHRWLRAVIAEEAQAL
jgi:DNA-binding transcriptional LysR family regulator